MSKPAPLSAAELAPYCDPEIFSFETTTELEDLHEVIGQPRAVEAVRFGMGIGQDGYNIFALGSPGSGKRSLVTRFFEQRAQHDPVPPDWCYVHNFEQEHKPKVIQLPAGKGAQFRKDMEQMIEELRTALIAAFESDEYRARRQAIEEEFQGRQEESLEEIQEKAKEHNLTLIRTPTGLIFAPVRENEVISPDEFQKLSEEERQELEKHIKELQDELQTVLHQVPQWQRELRRRIKELNQEMTTFAVGGLMDELREKYADHLAVVDYLDQVQKDVVENARDFLPQDEVGDDSPEGTLATLIARRQQQSNPLRRYQVNLLVDHQDTTGAPVIYEDNPNYNNLVGRVEHIAQMGALVTDFNLIKAGCLHNANGGYLIIDARQLLMQPYAWEALKRALQSSQIRIESPGQMLSLVSTISLEPEPIPLNLKVALLGERTLYYLLSQLEPEFNELFKVQADFEEQMDRDSENQRLYARLLASLVHKYELRELDRSAVARVIDQSVRIVSDSEKLSTRMGEIGDLLREANYWAGENGNEVINRNDVQKAIDGQIFRADRIRERLQESILRGTILIDTSAEVVGQINGLSVLQLGGFAFGMPSRITARVRLGKGEVIDIEREVEMSGPIHSKGVLILSGFLGARYAKERPLSLTASLVFEQSYSGVEGDSASSAELYALLSAIADVPIIQSLAVTGSVNQRGQVQAIGGVNEKIEGFFDICRARGLDGKQGVLIPKSNVKNLMLRREVVQAVEADKFHIYPVEDIDQGIELLTSLSAGEPDEKGNYPEGTFNAKVQAELDRLAKSRDEASQDDEEEGL